MSTTVRDRCRAHLPAHPTAKHTWARGRTPEGEHYDEMPMTDDGTEVYEPTGKPRHRAEPAYVHTGFEAGAL